jgi:hypothetical protein
MAKSKSVSRLCVQVEPPERAAAIPAQQRLARELVKQERLH